MQKNSEDISLVKLSKEGNGLSLEEWRQKLEREVFIERTGHRLRFVGMGLLMGGVVIVLPFLLIRKWVKHNRTLVYSALVIIIQGALVAGLYWGQMLLWASPRIILLSKLLAIGIFVEVLYVAWATSSRRPQGNPKPGT